MHCEICRRIEQIRRGENPYFVCELETGYVVLGDHQRFRGYTLLLGREHVTELFWLSPQVRQRFLAEMTLVAQAVYNVFHPDKMNYELLGNGDSHVHWHLFPRVAGDVPGNGPVWWLPPEELWDDACRPTPEALRRDTELLRREIERLRKQEESICV